MMKIFSRLFRLVSLLPLMLPFLCAAPAGATTTTLTLMTGGTTGVAAGGYLMHTGQSRVVDFSSRTSLKEATWTTTTANTVVQLFNIPAGSLVLGVSAQVITAEGATCTCSIGDSVSSTGYISSVNLNAVGYAQSFNCVVNSAYGDGKLYTSAGVIYAVLANQCVKARVKFKVWYIDLN